MSTKTITSPRSESELHNIVTEAYDLGPDALMKAITSKFSVAFVSTKKSGPLQVRPALGQTWENRKTGRPVEVTRLSEGLSGYPLIYAKHTDLLNAPAQGISATEWHRTYNFLG